jgi:ureidoacrylate peracid hydrolase
VDAQALQAWSTFFDHLVSPARREQLKTAYAPGARDHELWPALDVQPQDIRLEKRRFSAFIQGSSQLDEQLRARGIDTVVITGTVTNVCSESTARDAMMLNYKVVFVSDGNAALDNEEHSATLGSLASHFADVRTTDEVVSILR